MIYWYTESLGMYPLIPSLSELIQRNISTLRYHLIKAADSPSESERGVWLDLARSNIREHNRLVRENRRVRELCR